MKVTNENTELLDYSRKLDNRLRTQNEKKEKELKGINELYEKRIEDAKAAGHDKFLNTLKRNDDLLVSASLDYENKINSYRENLNKTQNNLDHQSLVLKEDHTQKMDNFKEQFLSNTLDQFRNASETQREINDQMKDKIRDITDESIMQRKHIEESAKINMANLATDYDYKSAATERSYQNKLQSETLKHKESVKQELSQIKDMSSRNAEKNKRLLNEKTAIQKAELDFLDHHQKDLMLQKNADFKVRYEKMVKEHNDLLGELKTHLDADIKKMVEENASKKKEIVNKSEDRFYKIETLNPKITENEKEYYVSLTVPEFEKENVHLSVKGRNLKLTLTRRFADTLQDSNGVINRSTRNELFSHEFGCKDILNQKSIDQKYENGELTFRIQKA